MVRSLFSQPPAEASHVRRPAVAGAFYPAEDTTLRHSVQTYMQQAQVPALPGRVRAVIAPHAGYVYSGPVAGYSYRALDIRPATEHRVLLLGPAHYVPVDGVAMADYDAFETPLGQLPVERTLLATLAAQDRHFRWQRAAHVPEHSLEVQLPFLQVRCEGGCRLAPLLLGHAPPEPIAETLAFVVTTDPLMRLVISSDLSHFYHYEQARALDEALIEAVISGDINAVEQGEACGRIPILILMHLAQRLGWQAHLLDYRNSGDTAGDRRRVVGYAAIAFTEPIS